MNAPTIDPRFNICTRRLLQATEIRLARWPLDWSPLRIVARYDHAVMGPSEGMVSEVSP